jgi:hypothetical protein
VALVVVVLELLAVELREMLELLILEEVVAVVHLAVLVVLEDQELLFFLSQPLNTQAQLQVAQQ